MSHQEHTPDTGADIRGELRDSVRRFAQRDHGFDKRMKGLAEPHGFFAEHWQTFAELGWLGVGLPESCGGFGDPLDQVVVAEELGRALVTAPWLENCALAAPLLARLGGTRCESLAGEIAAGEHRLALAAWERQGRHDAFDVATQAAHDAQGWRVDGRKTLVLGADSAGQLLVLARTAGGQRDTQGLSLFLVPADTPGVHLKALPTYDGRRTADLRLDAVRLPEQALLGVLNEAWPAVEAAIDHATVMLCAQSAGAMDRALELTREYLTTRKQFGKAITENQVVRHRLVDMRVANEQARAITEAAAQALDADPAVRRRLVSIAKAFVSGAGRRVGEDGVQLHGAIGMTDDYEVGQCYKRLAVCANLFGDAEWHHARLAQA